MSNDTNSGSPAPPECWYRYRTEAKHIHGRARDAIREPSCKTYDGSEGIVEIVLDTYEAIRRTAKGAWVLPEGWVRLPDVPGKGVRYWHERTGEVKPRWVSNKVYGKSWCYPTKERALKSLMIRKQRQVEHLKRNLEWAEIALEKTESALEDKFWEK